MFAKMKNHIFEHINKSPAYKQECQNYMEMLANLNNLNYHINNLDYCGDHKKALLDIKAMAVNFLYKQNVLVVSGFTNNSKDWFPYDYEGDVGKEPVEKKVENLALKVIQGIFNKNRSWNMGSIFDGDEIYSVLNLITNALGYRREEREKYTKNEIGIVQEYIINSIFENMEKARQEFRTIIDVQNRANKEIETILSCADLLWLDYQPRLYPYLHPHARSIVEFSAEVDTSRFNFQLPYTKCEDVPYQRFRLFSEITQKESFVNDNISIKDIVYYFALQGMSAKMWCDLQILDEEENDNGD